MDVLPIPGDWVQVPVGHSIFEGIVVNTSDTGSEPRVTIEIHIPDVPPYTATFPLRYVEPVPGRPDRSRAHPS